MNKKGTVSRLMAEMVGPYKITLLLVVIFVLLSTFANVSGSFFIERLIDHVLPPLLLENAPSFSALIKLLLFMGLVYLAGVVATLLYNRMMVTVSQGVQKSIRDKLFMHMQALPIRYSATKPQR